MLTRPIVALEDLSRRYGFVRAAILNQPVVYRFAVRTILPNRTEDIVLADRLRVRSVFITAESTVPSHRRAPELCGFNPCQPSLLAIRSQTSRTRDPLS